MLHAIVEWLDRVGPMVFWTCLAVAAVAPAVPIQLDASSLEP